MGNETDALQLLHEVLSLPEDERTPLLQSDATRAAVGELYRVLESDPENGEIRHLLGWWHEFVSSVTTAEQERDEHQAQAVKLLLPIYLTDPDQVPGRVRASLLSLAESMGDFAAESLHRIWDGTATVSLDEVIEAAVQAVYLTPTNHPARAGRLSNLGLALRIRFERTGALDDLNNAISRYRAATESPTAPPLTGCEAAASWGRLCTDDDAAEAFDTALELLPRVTAHSLGYEDALAHGGSLSNLGRDAATAYIASGDPERAVTAVEQAGAATYSRMLYSRSDISELRSIQPRLAERISKALEVLNEGTRLQGISPDQSDLSPDQIATNRRKAGADLEEVLAEVRQLGGPWTRFFLAPDIDGLIRAAAQGPLITLVVSERRCDALVTTTDGVQLVPLPALTEDDSYSQVNSFVTATSRLSDYRSTLQEWAEAHQAISEVCGWMWDVIVGPVMMHLGYGEPTLGDDYPTWPRVWWIPTGPLAILPIHAAGHHDGGPAVMDRVISSTLPTIGTLIASRSKSLPEEGSRRALLVGMPQTPPMGDQPIFDLPGVAAEVSQVQSRLHATPQLAFVEGLDGAPQPTKQAVLEQLPQHAWVHLACHAYSDPGNPTRSILLLSDHQDDPFTVLDLTSAPSNAGQLLFLSACTTARTGFNNLDEPVHFAAAALLAGYRQVIATLWPLQDDTGAEVADFIYSELTTDGHPISWGADDAAIAVHRAVQDQRRTPGTPIYTWATFVHFGA